jgi:hypothetical protein
MLTAFSTETHGGVHAFCGCFLFQHCRMCASHIKRLDALQRYGGTPLHHSTAAEDSFPLLPKEETL